MKPPVSVGIEKSLPHVCSDCGKSFEYPSRLARHRASKHPKLESPDSNKHVCRDCGRGFAVAAWLTRHRIKAHNNSFASKKHMCGVCGRSFALASWLTRHQKIHENAVIKSEEISVQESIPTASLTKKTYLLPWVCGDCGVRFKYVSWLKRHQKNSKHSNGHFDSEDQASLYKWACDHPGCGKSYKMKHHLARHKLSHLRDPKAVPQKPEKRETNYVCEVCGKEFITRRMFTRHERKHAKRGGTSAKSECSICSKSFDTKDLLERHLKRIHGNELSAESNASGVGPPYSCRYCSKKFKETLAFGRHIAQHKNREKSLEAMSELQRDKNIDNSDHVTNKSKLLTTKDSVPSKSLQNVRDAPERDTKRDKGRYKSSGMKKTQDSESNPFECDICGRRFAVSFWLTRHKAEHELDERPHKCDECGRTFAVAAWLTRHKREHEIATPSDATNENSKPEPIVRGNAKVYKCDICGMEFSWPSWMLKHRKLHNGTNLTNVKKKGKTKITSKVTKSPPPVIKPESSNPYKGKPANEMFELLDKNGIKEYQCKICKKTTIWHTGIIYHVRVHHTHEKPFKCKFCSKTFHMAGDLTKHNRRHTDEEMYDGNQSSKSFESEKAVKKHVNSHNKSTPFRCKYCGQAYRNRSSVWRHISRRACPESRDATKNKDSASVAVKRAKKTLQNVSSEPTMKKAKVASSKQTDKKMDADQIKQESAGQPENQKEDKSINMKKVKGKGNEKKTSKKKSHVCKNCNKTFSSKEAFKTHIEKYKENSQIVCEYCGKCWVRTADLKRHLRVHTGERPFTCPECGLGFKVSDALKRHMIKLHPKSTKKPIIAKAIGISDDGSYVQGEQSSTDYANEAGEMFVHDDVKLQPDETHPQGNDEIQSERNIKRVRKPKQKESKKEHKNRENVNKDDENQKKTQLENVRDANAKKEKESIHIHDDVDNAEENKKTKKLSVKTTKKKKKITKNKCEYCGKLYSGPGNLTRHVRLHTGEKPFKCKECGECFMRSDILAQHIGKHHYVE